MIFISDKDYETAAKNGISKHHVYNRVINCEWTIEKAITDPVKRRRKTSWTKLEDIANKTGITRTCFYYRVKSGMTPEEAATTPKIKSKGNPYPRKNAKITQKMFEIAEANGISKGTLKQRIYIRNWPVERALTEPIHNRGRRKQLTKNTH